MNERLAGQSLASIVSITLSEVPSWQILALLIVPICQDQKQPPSSDFMPDRYLCGYRSGG